MEHVKKIANPVHDVAFLFKALSAPHGDAGIAMYRLAFQG